MRTAGDARHVVDMESAIRPPRLRTKLIFWLLLSVLSVAIAEVSVASSPLAFVNPLEGLFLLLFYGSHLLFFSWVSFRRGWPSLASLWFAGVLFGMYEFYITKVLWVPPWGDVITVGYIDVVAFIVLAFFWHPFMAFILPLFIGESIGTNTRWVRSLLPGWLTSPTPRRLVISVGVAAVTHGMLTGSATVAAISTLSAAAAFVVAARWWRRNGRRARWTLRDLLPSDRQARWIAALLAVQYAAFIPLWNPEKMPSASGHVVVWLMYAGFGFLLASALGTSAASAKITHTQRASRTNGSWVAAAAIVGLTVLGSALPPEFGFVPVWLVAIVVGLRMAYRSFRAVLRPTIPADASSAALPPDDRGAGPAHRS